MQGRKSIRLKGYDYTQAGAYFITICTKDRRNRFGTVREGIMQMSSVGRIVQKCWNLLPVHFPNVQVDAFMVMPNHVHGIVVILDDPPDFKSLSRGGGVHLNTPTGGYYSHISPRSGSLSVIIRTFKAAVTTWCWRNGHTAFAWQRGYYDHIIRNERSLARIREYIVSNPTRWEYDRNNVQKASW
jgi:putative transposase